MQCLVYCHLVFMSSLVIHPVVNLSLQCLQYMVFSGYDYVVLCFVLNDL